MCRGVVRGEPRAQHEAPVAHAVLERAAGQVDPLAQADEPEPGAGDPGGARDRSRSRR